MNLDEVLAKYVSRRTSRLRRGLVVGAVGVALGAGLFYWGSTALGAIVGGVAGLILIFAAIGLLTAADDAGAKLLREQRGDIVWAYYLQNHGIVFGLRSGGGALLANAEEWMLNELRPLLGHATLGFTPELERRFAQNPASLARMAS
jgi:hypothetical protein